MELSARPHLELAEHLMNYSVLPASIKLQQLQKLTGYLHTPSGVCNLLTDEPRKETAK
jgi:hypothetical protein